MFQRNNGGRIFLDTTNSEKIYEAVAAAFSAEDIEKIYYLEHRNGTLTPKELSRI